MDVILFILRVDVHRLSIKQTLSAVNYTDGSTVMLTRIWHVEFNAVNTNHGCGLINIDYNTLRWPLRCFQEYCEHILVMIQSNSAWPGPHGLFRLICFRRSGCASLHCYQMIMYSRGQANITHSQSSPLFLLLVLCGKTCFHLPLHRVKKTYSCLILHLYFVFVFVLLLLFYFCCLFFVFQNCQGPCALLFSPSFKID